MGLNWKRKALMIKLESTYGTDSVPTAVADGILATNISLEPMLGQDVSRDLERPFTGAQPTIPVDLHAKLSFRVELAGGGGCRDAAEVRPASARDGSGPDHCRRADAARGGDL